MKAALMIIAGTLLASVACLPASAQTADDRQLAETICQDQTGEAFKACVQQQTQSCDCTAVIDRAQCEARKDASQRCAGLFGWEFRQCINPEERGQPDCSKAADPQRCEQGR